MGKQLQFDVYNYFSYSSNYPLIYIYQCTLHILDIRIRWEWLEIIIEILESNMIPRKCVVI